MDIIDVGCSKMPLFDRLTSLFYLNFRFKTQGQVSFGMDKNEAVEIGYYGQLLNL